MMSGHDLQPYSMWCFGLSDNDVDRIRLCAEGCTVTARDPELLRDEAALVKEDPSLLWIHLNSWKQSNLVHFSKAASTVPKVLVMDAARTENDLDAFVATDAEHVLRAPLTQDGIHRILRRTLEVCSIHQDMGRMTREILMHRDMMLRKDNVLSLLFESEAALSRAVTTPDILAALRSTLSSVFPLIQMHAVLWDAEEEDEGLEIYYDGLIEQNRRVPQWRELLVDAALRLGGAKRSLEREIQLFDGTSHGPMDGHLLLLPLQQGHCHAGALLLLLSHETACSRDENRVVTMLLRYGAGLIRLAQRSILHPRLSPDHRHAPMPEHQP